MTTFSEIIWLAFFLQAYYLMQSPETKAAGDAVGFGSAFLFACVFGMFHLSRALLLS